MKIVEKLADFPRSAPRLRGLALEALNLLQEITPDKQVLVVAPETTNVAAAKRAFAAVAKFTGRRVETRNGENGTILVRYSAARTLSLGRAKPPQEHLAAAIEAEMKRLYVAAGNKESDFRKLSSDAQRKLSISAKRNLSRKAAA